MKRNIRNFGGDPNRVFVFDSSAGGGNICALMTSPLAQGLFHGASMESSVSTGCELQTLAQREQGAGARIVAAVHCTDAKDIAGCLRSRSVEEIVGPIPGYTDIFTRTYGPSVDGHVFPDQPNKMIQAKRYKPIPVIIGTSAAETRAWLVAGWPALDPATYSDLVKKLFGSKAHDAILAHYPVTSFPTPLAALEAVTVDAYFSCTSRRVAHMLASVQTEPVYQCFFTHETDPKRGAGHSAASRFPLPMGSHEQAK